MLSITSKLTAVALTLLFLTVSVTTAQQLTTTTTYAQSKLFSVMKGKFLFSFRTFNGPDPDAPTTNIDQVEIYCKVEGRYDYFSIGIGPAIMTGPIVACYFDPVSLRTVCSDWDGKGTDIDRRPQTLSRVVNASANGTTWDMYFTTPVSNIDGANKWQRVIFGYGPYSMADNEPEEHPDDGYTDGLIHLYKGEMRINRTNRHTIIAIIVILIVFVLWLIAAFILRSTPLRPRVNLVLSVLSVCLWFVLLVFYATMRFLDHAEGGGWTSGARMFGDAAVFCFVTILFPVMRHYGVCTIMGSAMERLLVFHVIVGIIVWVCLTVHLIWFAVTMPFSDLLGDGHANNSVIGLIAWALDTIILVSSLLRRWFYMPFRVIHWLFLPTLVMGVIHYPPLGLGLIIPFLNYLVEKVLTIIVMARAKPTLVDVKFHEEMDTCELAVQLSENAAPPSEGQYALITIPALLSLIPHPFTVGWFDKEKRVAYFYIKRMGSEISWTSKLCNAIKEGKITTDSTIIYQGPYGKLQIPLGSTPYAMLVGGGIGITPILNLLQTIAEEPEMAEKYHGVVVVWSLRSVALLNALAPKFAECKEKLSSSRCQIFAHLTGSDKTEIDEAVDKAGIVVIRDRPIFSDILAERFPEGEPVGSYSCGPAAMMESVAKASQDRPATYVHEETFDF